MIPKPHRALCDAAWTGDVTTIEHCLADPEVLACSDVDTALMHASHRGHAKVVMLLLSRTSANPNARNAEALWRAARYRRRSVARLLMPLSDTRGWEDWQWDELTPAMQRMLGRGAGM